MALIDLDLSEGGTYVLDPKNSVDGDVVSINALGTTSTLLVNNVDVEIISIAGVVAGATPTFTSMNNATLTLNQGLLNIQALSGFNFNIVNNGNIVLDGSTISSGLTHLFTDYNIEYDGLHMGSFLYKPPTIGLLDAVSFNVSGMQAGDEFNVGEGRSWQLSTRLLGGDRSAYRNGMLHLTSPGGLLAQRVDVAIPMTQSEADTFFASKAEYLNPQAGVFIFPGDAVCFAQGSLLLTDSGYKAVEHLAAGDVLKLVDGRHERIRWVGFSAISEHMLGSLTNLRPIRLRKDCLAKGYPFADLVVSPQHRVWVNGHAVRELTDGEGGLIAVKHLLGINGVEIAHDIKSVRYYHVLLDKHEVLWSNGLPTESLLIGKHIARHMAPALRRDIIHHVPEAEQLFSDREVKSGYQLLKGQIARKITKRNAHHAESYFDPAILQSRVRDMAVSYA